MNCNQPEREIIEVPFDEVPESAHLVSEELALALFPEDTCVKCGCPRVEDSGARTHQVLTIGAFMPTHLSHIERVECDYHPGFVCWAYGDVV